MVTTWGRILALANRSGASSSARLEQLESQLGAVEVTLSNDI
jgi:hypothetical protein